MNRRVFLQSVFLVSGGLVLTRNTTLASSLARPKIRGRVTAGGKRLANVVVSDGFSLTTTNSKGKYELPFNRAAKFVFISLPSGYAFPAENSIAKHYHVLKDGVGEYDFQLSPLTSDDSRHNFIVWADPQVKDENDVALMMSQSVPDVQKLVQELGPDALIHGLGVGDLVWDVHPLFKSYNQAVGAMGIPFFQVVGNHDMDYDKGGDDVSDDTFEAHYGPTYYSFNRGKAHYVVLDDVRYLGKKREYDGYISQQQLNWLKLDLEQVPKDHLIILSVHIPVHNSVKNNADLYAILAPFKNVHIMSGHTHYNRNVISKGIYEHNHGTVCGAWWTGNICTDGTPNGYGVYEVEGTELKWFYKGTGQEKNYQLSVHVEELTNQQRMLANVWNYDPQWKVEWWADDQYMGVLESVEGYDPVAVNKFKGDKLPVKRSFAEPTRTNHLFMAHFNPGVKKVKVVATDRFGTPYEQVVNI
ncbi:MAG TPA: calcineurin-like phosphoesterase family protein [Sphingobacteriaceae bacterium]